MTVSDILATTIMVGVAPATLLETSAFNPKISLKNQTAKELLARLTAIVAPIFWAYQTLTLTLLTIGCGIGATVRLVKTKRLFKAANLTRLAFQTIFSSILEMPQKIIFGPHNPPNYFGMSNRYEF